MGESRKSGPGSKTRSGCVTCKSRRVKCDEAKPTCMRCRNMRLECGGYTVKQKFKPVQRLLPLVPKIITPLTTVISKTPNSQQPFFTNDQEFCYFRVFCDTTAPNLGEYLDKSLWSHIVLQASEQESFIKHAVIALGALNKSQHVTATAIDFSGLALRADSAHYQAAFQQYGKSIQGIRKACVEDRKSKRTILIACLLAICFEYYHGNIDLAIAHIQNGIKLIDEWFLSIKHLATVHAEHFLPGLIEDELISIFTRLQLDVFGWHEKELITMHPDLQKVAMDIIQAIPIRGFANLNTARKYFDITLTQVDSFVYLINEQLWAAAKDSIGSRSPPPIHDRVGVIVPSTAQQVRAIALKQGLLSWHRAFQPVLAQSLKSGGNESLVAKALSLRLTCSTIALDCSLATELSYDSYIFEFRTALSLAETLSAEISSRTRPTFIISSILIRSLHFIALKCRITTLRTRAISFLQSMSRREGIWDSKVASIVATVVMELEESFGDDFVPEGKRVRGVKTSFNLRKRRGNLKYLMKTDSEAVGFVTRQIELSW